jgi:hypothetical protein
MSNLDACPAKGFDLRRHSWPDLGDPARKNGKKTKRKNGKKERSASAQAANDNGRGCPRPLRF